jgi:hypothetical protein
VSGMDNVTKALALARIGIKVFPVLNSNRQPAIKGGRGFYDATSDDFEQIATWFTLDFAEEDKYEVGYWAGGSGLFVADLDRGKGNGKDGFASMAKLGLDSGDTYFYPTKSGGEHHVFESDNIDLSLSKDHGGVEGVDIRAGNSYAVWWGDTVPSDREEFSKQIPAWMTKASAPETEFSGEGFSGSVSEWMESIPDDILPSGKVRYFMESLPEGDFGHSEMVDLAWGIVRMGSERETGVGMALGKLRDAWLRGDYDTEANRRDFDVALKGAILKAGRVQYPTPIITSAISSALKKAAEKGVDDELRSLEHKVSETSSEIDYARVRKDMFRIAAGAGLSPGTALSIVVGSRAFKNSKVSVDSAWFGDGEPEFHDIADVEEEGVNAAQEEIDRKVEDAQRTEAMSADAAKFSFLSEAEEALVASPSHEWWGNEYLSWVKKRLRHFNKPYHVAAMWSALSVITSPWGKVPLAGAKLTDCNLYIAVAGKSSTGKTESWEFGTGLIDAYYGLEQSPIIGDISKLSSLALHRALIIRDGKPSLVFGDEIQSFFQSVTTSQWQSGILGDISSHYGGNVNPKLTLNDKEISGKRAKTLFTSYLTGIDDQLLEAINIEHWTNGFLYRFLWGFGNPRESGDHSIKMETTSSVYTAQYETWVKEFKRVKALQEIKWGLARTVYWEPDALKRMEKFKEQIDTVTKTSLLYDDIFVNANGRLLTSILKVATIVAMTEASEKVELKHVLIALSYAGPWHRSMVLAVIETGKEPFERDVERCLTWIRRNAIRQVGKPAIIQRTAVMRQFKPNEIADRLLRQLTEEGWLIKTGDKYELSED